MPLPRSKVGWVAKAMAASAAVAKSMITSCVPVFFSFHLSAVNPGRLVKRRLRSVVLVVEGISVIVKE